MRTRSPTQWRRSGRLGRSPRGGACRQSRCPPRQSRSRLVSRVVGECVDEGLVVGFVWARRNGDRLLVGLLGELRGSDVGNPDLDRSQPLFAESLAMGANTDGAG